MLRITVKEYVDRQIEQHGYAFFPNSFPFIDIENDELALLFKYLSEKKITALHLGSKIAWKITTLPDNLGKITSLTKLYINSRTIDHMPDSIGKLINLENLNLSKSKIVHIPTSIDKLVKLKKLHLGHLKIEQLPNITHLKILEILTINDTKIKIIPDYLCQLKFLTSIDVRNLELEYFPPCLIDQGIKIKTNDVANLGLVNVAENSYQVFIKIQDEIRIVIKEYLSYFNQFIKRKRKDIINFSIDEIENGLVLNIKVHNDEELEELKNDLSEYIGFTEKTENEIIPHISTDTSKYDLTMLMIELKQKIRHYHQSMENTKDNLKVVSQLLNIEYDELEHISAKSMIEGFQKLSACTPVSNIYLEQNQEQYQQQHQTQKLKNDLSALTNNLDALINLIQIPELKQEGQKILDEIYPIATKPTEDKVEQSGLLPKLKNYVDKAKASMDLFDDGKTVYNRFAESYNGIAKILGYTALNLLS